MNIYENYATKIIFDILENLRYLKDNLLGIIYGPGDRTRTDMIFLSRDFLTTLCHHSRIICVVVWTMSLP